MIQGRHDPETARVEARALAESLVRPGGRVFEVGGSAGQGSPPAGARFDLVVFSQVLAGTEDVQEALERARVLVADEGRLLLTQRGRGSLPWDDVRRLLRLTGFEAIDGAAHDTRSAAARFLANLSFTAFTHLVARPVSLAATLPLSVSVICPCRNERGNIRDAIPRTPLMGPETELVFVDGNSNDGTVEEIEAAIREYDGPLSVRLVHQGAGKGKGDAVRKGFDAARNDFLVILDADLTVPPEDLPKFYRAVAGGHAELANGVRLAYPMEDGAMRPLNFVGNKFFSRALSWVLGQPIGDSLCGTKALRAHDYRRIAENRHYFGDFDPFGDFDLLFGAARLGLQIADVPVRYRARTYGETKIHRFTHGWLLLRMTAFGAWKLKLAWTASSGVGVRAG